MSSDPSKLREGTVLSTYEAVRVVRLLADMTGVRTPLVAHRPSDGVVAAEYSEDSQTIMLVHGAATAETVLHEFQHYLDDLHGQPLEGATRGVHDRSFYTRLKDLRARFTQYVQDLTAASGGTPGTPTGGP